MLSFMQPKSIRRAFIASTLLLAPLTLASEVKSSHAVHTHESAFELMQHAHGELDARRHRRKSKQIQPITSCPEGDCNG